MTYLLLLLLTCLTALAGGDLKLPAVTDITGFSLEMPPGCEAYAECVQVTNETQYYLAPKVRGQRWKGATTVKDANGKPVVIYDGRRMVSALAPGQTAWIWALQSSTRLVAKAYDGDRNDVLLWPCVSDTGSSMLYTRYEMSRFTKVGTFIGDLRSQVGAPTQARLVIFQPANTKLANAN